MPSKKVVDYTLYLVTGRELLPPGRDYYEHLEEALRGGVTLVQVREKHADTAEFLEIARGTQRVCDRHGVPVIINDRIDIALAIKAFGVHIGQTDMPIDVVRRLVPSSTVIGMSVSSVEEAEKANKAGVDYVGIGAIYPTNSKKLTKDAIGVRKVGDILSALDPEIKAVAIGGIKQANLIRTLHGSVSPLTNKALDGVAIISEIVASQDPFTVSQSLSRTVRSFVERPFPHLVLAPWSLEGEAAAGNIQMRAAQMISHVRRLTPLVHQITNAVVTTQSANITLALGGSPIMATAPQEMDDLGSILSALLVNYGTLQESTIEGMRVAGYLYGVSPVVFDPVGVGATEFRRSTANELLNLWQATVIKGNAGEISALAGMAEVKSRGVDSVGSGFSDPARVVKHVALRERCIVVMTGKDDWISDGNIVVKLSNGNEWLGKVSGTGCIVGTAIATFCGAANMLARKQSKLPPIDLGNGRLVQGDMLTAAIAGVLAITVAAEIAAGRIDVRGPGTFLPALIDEVANLTPIAISSRAKVMQVV
ncbi:Hydroxyethylthiazole kinase [Clavulina sp. PMI_390]|nr:Hydroxyethylthiazole kinase [Clavulina sp. PMI_390]